jgi:hypothetical protein
MTLSNRGFRGRNGFQHGRAQDEQSENSGNRKTFDEVRVPPDNIGNKVEDLIAEFVHDNRGNSFEEEPTHLKSGILAYLTQAAAKNTVKRSHMLKTNRPKVSPPTSDQPEEYFARLKAEFAKLLSTKTGLAFSFSMKTMPLSSDDKLDKSLDNELEDVYNLIIELLDANTITAEVALEHYQTASHRFAVFFIKPEESENTKNKELIVALRQVISAYTSQKVKTPVNIFLVLANAQPVIEDHLFKIGAKKVILEA